MRFARMIAAAAAALVLTACATALPYAPLDTSAPPNFGTVNLRVGYTPDPHIVPLLAGGNLDARGLGGNCRGSVTAAPDVRLVYSSGVLPLIISVDASADTTLVINAPDGSWHCNDDGGSGLNPSIRFNQPLSGRYEIWVGTYQAGGARPANLFISELDSQ